MRWVAFIPEVERESFADEGFFDLDGTVNNLPDADRAKRFEQAVLEDTGRQNHSEELHDG
jgi:hypothetical protein